MFYKKACYNRLLGKEDRGRVRVVVGTFHQEELTNNAIVSSNPKPALPPSASIFLNRSTQSDIDRIEEPESFHNMISFRLRVFEALIYFLLIRLILSMNE